MDNYYYRTLKTSENHTTHEHSHEQNNLLKYMGSYMDRMNKKDRWIIRGETLNSL